MPSLRDVGVAVVIASFYRAFVPAGRWALVSVFVLLYRAFVPAGRCGCGDVCVVLPGFRPCRDVGGVAVRVWCVPFVQPR